jgi:hypothetical protein
VRHQTRAARACRALLADLVREHGRKESAKS